MMKKQEGVTLIALVVTIIVLLILAGISIATLTGENGILTNAQKSKLETRGATVEEARNIWKTTKEADRLSNSTIAKSLEELINDLVKQNQLTEDEKDIILGNEEKGIEAKYEITIGSRTIDFKDNNDKNEKVTEVYAKLYSYKDGTEGYKLELSNNSDYSNIEMNLVNDFENKDVEELRSKSGAYPWKEYSITTIEVVNKIVPKGVGSYFSNMMELKTIDGLKNLDTSNVNNMYMMFWECRSLTSLDLNSLDTSNVNNMDMMFFGCRSLTSLDLSSFDTSNVESMHQMFEGCTNLVEINVSTFDTSKVTDMSCMFRYCWSLKKLDLRSFNTGNVIDMAEMFVSCSELEEVLVSSSKWKTDQANTRNMFSEIGGGVKNVTYE